ncbi:hypothetical protein GCM10010245_82470 [Streptomyces spectabilis]|uniref:DNA processing protein n=1 Tax=Streptomyces spectabilis TaxID=68270 RepID=A0A7W8EZD4_STRST|nr:DNA-processing protein DprA [Streptomyces spectabilis]MBB5109318.1 DNA processing protein [Streptomyces spectabilis]GGV52394.1 hypothetical protein GCM10010245_82470 [Streptomyces spectabilis]
MPENTLSDRAALAALSTHFRPEQVASDLASMPPNEVWRQRALRDVSGRLAGYTPPDVLADARTACPFIIPSDPQWPAALDDLGPACPLGLWVRGHDQLPRLTANSVTVTGNRIASDQALAQAQVFARALAAAGHTVTATLAFGVDCAAQRAAAHEGHATLAVLPRGLDRAHPHANAPLLRSIPANGGAVVSLYPPGTVPSGVTLKDSARLLVALTGAVVLIEGADHSAATHVAETALALKRPLFAVPASGDVRSSGNARLLSQQRAMPCPEPAYALALL